MDVSCPGRTIDAPWQIPIEPARLVIVAVVAAKKWCLRLFIHSSAPLPLLPCLYPAGVLIRQRWIVIVPWSIGREDERGLSFFFLSNIRMCQLIELRFRCVKMFKRRRMKNEWGETLLTAGVVSSAVTQDFSLSLSLLKCGYVPLL